MKEIIVKNVASYSIPFQDIIMLNVDLEYPAIICKHMHKQCKDKTFNTYYKKRILELSDYSIKKLYPSATQEYEFRLEEDFPFSPYFLENNYLVKYLNYPIISLYMDKYEFTGGAHGMTFRDSQTWNLNYGKRLTLSQLFKKNYSYKKVILQEIKKQAHEREDSKADIYFDHLDESIERYYDPKNYYLTDKGIVIYYPLYTIAPYSEGIQEFVIPYSMFNGNILYEIGKSIWDK